MNAVRLGVLAVVGALLWGLAAPARADDPEKAAEAFQSLYGADLARVRESGETRDDLELAAKLLETARKSTDQPAFLAILCQTVADLAMVHPVGYAQAAEALELVAAQVPEKAAACRERLLEVRQRQFDTARGDEKQAAGEAILDLLLPVIEAKEAAGDVAEATALYRRAKAIARAARSPRTADIDARAEALAQRMRLDLRIADVRAILEKDPANVSVREGLVRLLLVDRDDPAEAAKVLPGCKDKDLLKYVPALAKPVEAAPELACLELGEWYVRLADVAPAYAKAAMYARARPYLERFLEVHTAADLARTRGQVALEKVTEAMAKLAAPPAPPPKREKPTKPEPPQSGVIKPGPWVDLLALVDPGRDAVAGEWSAGQQGLTMTGPGGTRLAIPVSVEGDYQLQVQFAQVQGDNEVAFILPVGPRSTALLIGKEVRRRSGLFWAEKGDKMVSPAPLTMREPHTLDVTVKTQTDKADIDVRLDGKPYFRWQGGLSSVTVWDAYRLPQAGCLGLGAWGGEVSFTSVKLRMLSGAARPLRAPR